MTAVPVMAPHAGSPEKKKRKAKPKAASASTDPVLTEEDEAAQAAALMAEVFTFRKPLQERVKLNLESLKIAHPLAFVTPAHAVSDELKDKADSWELWTSEDSTLCPSPTFEFTYEAEERLVCTKGKAIVTPTDAEVGSTIYGALCEDGTVVAPITIMVGDSVVFMEGFQCKWEILEPMEYKWVYTEAVIQRGWSHVWCKNEEELSTHRGRIELSHRGSGN